MCNNTYYSEERKQQMEVMGKYAVEILKGKSVQELASEKGLSTDKILEILRDIKTVNPYLYNQLKEVLGEML